MALPFDRSGARRPSNHHTLIRIRSMTSPLNFGPPHTHTGASAPPGKGAIAGAKRGQQAARVVVVLHVDQSRPHTRRESRPPNTTNQHTLRMPPLIIRSVSKQSRLPSLRPHTRDAQSHLSYPSANPPMTHSGLRRRCCCSCYWAHTSAAHGPWRWLPHRRMWGWPRGGWSRSRTSWRGWSAGARSLVGTPECVWLCGKGTG